ncbi:MAG TPA: formate--tetrahydrofolate ligase [bacterium]|nr:formate--tetrahydrofolate ligase [bacterium]
MPTDLDIASQVSLRPIADIAAKLGLRREHLEPYGDHIAKVRPTARALGEPQAKQVLVTAMTPTPLGEGKTTVAIGLSEALNRIGKRSIVTLREPSLGPVFGVKGGAAGGGWSQVLPMTDINLHFTGDIHAVTTAHNLLAALIDNQYSRVTQQCLLPREIVWHRVMDMNDRSLRNIVIGLGKESGQVRESKFEITASSEVMAILALAYDLDDLKKRLGDIIVAVKPKGEPLHAHDLNAHGAMAILLANAIKPNLVQTIEGNPAFIHAGPFANIAHGTNSIIATDLARRLSDIVVTEAGFASDLGGEKFFNLVSRQKGMTPPDAVVVVATVRALKYHGGVVRKDLGRPDPGAVERGFPNLEKHIGNMRSFDRPVLVALNRFPGDSDDEIAAARRLCERHGAVCFPVEVWAKGGAGATELAAAVWGAAHDAHGPVRYTYELDDPAAVKIEKVAKAMYGAEGVHIPRSVLAKIEERESWGYRGLPVCMAKTQSSLSDTPDLRGRPTGFTVEIRDVKVSAGAGFMVAYTSDIMTMPGLPETPASDRMDIDSDGAISGLF